MQDANNPQDGVPSSPEDKNGATVPNDRGPGVFRPTQTLQRDGEFDVYSRLTTRNPALRRQVDGIQRAENSKKLLSKEEEIRLATQIDFLIKRAEQVLELRLKLDDSHGEDALRSSFGEIIDELKEAKFALSSPELNQEILDQIKGSLKSREDDLDRHFDAHQETITEALTSKDDELANAAKEVKNIAATAKAELEKVTFVANLRRQYDRLANDINSLRNTTLSISSKDSIVQEYDSFSFLDTEDSPSQASLQAAYDRLPEIENLLSAATSELRNLEKEEERARNRLKIEVAIAITKSDSKRLEVASLLSNEATLPEKNSTEELIAEIDTLGRALLSDDVTQGQLDEFNQKLLELNTKATTLERLVREGSAEKMTVARQAEHLIGLFEQKKSAAENLLLNPVNSSESTDTHTLIAEMDVISSSLKSSSDIASDEVNTFIAKIIKLEDKIAELQTSVDAESSRQESMYSWHADWPKTIKYSEGKKADKLGKGKEQAGWKKDNVLLPATTQPIWSRANDQAKRIFEKYNTVIGKAYEAEMGETVKDLIAIKESIIKALYAERPEDALTLLTKLEKGVDLKRGAIENSAELKSLSVKFEHIISALEHLTPTLSKLERTLLDAKKSDLSDDLDNLKKEETQKDAVRSKGLLNLFKSDLEGLAAAVSEKEKDNLKATGIRLVEFREFDARAEKLRTIILSDLKGFISDEGVADLKKRLSDVERNAKKVASLETEKEYAKAKKLFSSTKEDLAQLEREVSQHTSLLTTSEQAEMDKRVSTERKGVEKNQEEAKRFSDAKSYFNKLKGEVESLSPTGDKKLALEKRSTELKELAASFEAETDKKKAKDLLRLFIAILGEFSTFVIAEVGNPDRIEEKLKYLKDKLASVSTKSGQRDLEEQIEDLEVSKKKITDLEDAYKAINGGRSKRPTVLRPEKSTNMVTAKVTTIDPVTDKPVTSFQEMTVEEWKAKQQGGSAIKESVLEERKRKTEEELREVHKKMWERDPEGYKSLYAGRVWGPENELTKKVVEELLKEKITPVQRSIDALSAEIARRTNLSAAGQERELTDAELSEIAEIDEQLAQLIEDKRSLTEKSYEEQLAELGSKVVGTSGAYTFSPGHAAEFDWIGFSNRAMTKEERKRFIKASIVRKAEAIRGAKDSIPGYTKETTSGPATSITKGDLGEGNEKLAQVAFKDVTKLGAPGTERVYGGMVRGVTEHELSKLKDSTLDHMTAALENGTEVDKKALSKTDPAFKNLANQGLYQEPIQAVEKRVLTQEEQERRTSKVNGLMETVKRFAKNNWKVLVNVALAGGVLGAASLATAGTIEGARAVTTLGQYASWKDFAATDSMDERKNAVFMQFIKDLIG